MLKVPVSAKALSEKRFVIQDSSVEEYVKSLEVSFGFCLSSFAFYEAAFFQRFLFDHICLNKACHNLRRVFNLSMYITNIIPHGKCFVRCVHTRCFV